MLASIAVVIIIILCTAQFYLKNSTLTSFATVISAVLGLLVAFGYYEWVAGFLISRGKFMSAAHGVCFAFLFAVTFVLVRALADFIVGSNIEFGSAIKTIAAIVSGIVVGIIISGVLVITAVLLPISPKLSYSRFSDSLDISSPKGYLLDTDAMITGFFNWMGDGSMASKERFSEHNADFLNKLHLNKRKRIKDNVPAIAGDKALVIPKGNVHIRQAGDTIFTDIRLGIKGQAIEDGGTAGARNSIWFSLAQIRLVCKETNKLQSKGGKIKVLYPERYKWPKGNWPRSDGQKRIDLDEVMKVSSRGLGKDKPLWIDLAFRVPNGMTGYQLQFKRNASVKVPAITSEDETGAESPPNG